VFLLKQLDQLGQLVQLDQLDQLGQLGPVVQVLLEQQVIQELYRLLDSAILIIFIGMTNLLHQLGLMVKVTYILVVMLENLLNFLKQ
jgi:hypothetical protein